MTEKPMSAARKAYKFNDRDENDPSYLDPATRQNWPEVHPDVFFGSGSMRLAGKKPAKAPKTPKAEG